MANKKKLRPVAVILLLVAAGGGWWYFSYKPVHDPNRLLIYGNVDIREVDLAFNASERIDELLVQEGDYVREGQLLATLHKTRVQAQYAAAEAGVASRRAALARLEAGSRPEEISQARAKVGAAKARLHEVKLSYDRIKKLRGQQVATEQALDDAQAALDTARADVKVTEQTLSLAVKGPRIEDIEEARANLKSAQAQLALAAALLKDTELLAPAAGVIRNRILEPGDMANPQTPVFTLAMNNPVWVRSYAPETVLGKLAPGMRAAVSTDSYPEKSYPAWVGYISPTAEFTPKNVETPELRSRLVYQLRVFVCNPQGELRLGMPATVRIALDQPRPKPGDSTPACGQ